MTDDIITCLYLPIDYMNFQCVTTVAIHAKLHMLQKYVILMKIQLIYINKSYLKDKNMAQIPAILLFVGDCLRFEV